MKAVVKPFARLSALMLCAALAAPLVAVAAPNHHEVCHVEHHNHHAVRVCHHVR